MIQCLRWCLFLTLCPLLLGCAAKTNHTLKFNPTEPIRVAVVPFVHVDTQGNIVEPDASLFIDRISFVSSAAGSSPADLLADMTRQKLIDRTALDLLSPPLVRSELVHHGFAAPDLTIDRAKVFNSKASDLCQHHLQCDAVLFGKVLRWDRSYYGLQAVATVGLELTLISARDNQVLFTTRGEDSDSRGITKGPTGIRDLLIAPVQGLDSKIVLDLAERLVSKLLAPLTKYLAIPRSWSLWPERRGYLRAFLLATKSQEFR